MSMRPVHMEPKQKEKDKILALFAEGKSAEVIARTLRMPWSSVWPIVRSLRGKKTYE